MKRLLIANRGEIATRIIRSARELGLETIAVYAPEDAAIAARYGADEVYALEGRGAAAYLDVPALVDVARQTGCDALHPGYGFLSERAEFAEACEQGGILFVGPDAATLALLGDKAQARALAEELDIPVVPGVPAPASATEIRTFLEQHADEAGLLIKAVAGGGGRGMRAVTQGDEVEAAFERCRSEALRSFGDGALFAERRIEGARHIEVQILGDGTGAAIDLGDRDCTLQRRHQKVVEIAPAPFLDQDLRHALRSAATRLARAVAYRGVGTIEFLVTPDDDFFFIEANARLQVEHTVTEEITGLDLVELQFEIARGRTLETLGLRECPPLRGYAVQCRILAESLDADGNTRASGGRLDTISWAGGPGVRIETALREGDTAHPAFDSMIAKLVVTSPSPEFDRLRGRTRRALDESVLSGIDTNLPFLRGLFDRTEWEALRFDTRFIDRNLAALLRAARRAPEEIAVAGGFGDGDPPTRSDADRSNRTSDEAPPDGVSAIAAPLLGTVLEIAVAEGNAVKAGQTLAVLESMKMEHVVEASATGTLERSFATVGAVVDDGAPLFWIATSGKQTRAESSGVRIDLETIRPDLAEVRERLSLLEDASRPEAVERRRSRDQRTARENLEALCDRGSFTEYGGLAIAAQRRARPVEDLRKRTPADAIITGTATINADRFGEEAARAAVLIADATVLAGTQGYFHHHKIDRILDVAERSQSPVVFFPEGGGGRPNDTDVGDISTAGLNVTNFGAFARLSGKVPRVSVVSGYCFAGSAAFAGCSDVIIATEGTSLGMGGPAMIEGGGLGVHAPEDVGPMSVQEPNGVVDVLVRDETEAVSVAQRYLGYFQGRESNWTYADQRNLRHLIPENRRRVYDMRAVIETLVDDDSVLELRPRFGVGMITALVRIEGHAFGLIANDPMHLGGAIDDTGSEKAARFLQLCDAFGLPILSLCDTPGFMVGPDIEARAQVRKVSRLFVVGASLTVPLFTVILRKGYGLGAQAMAGGSFGAPIFTLAWPTGEIGGMGLEGAVDLGFKKALDEQESPEARAALRTKLIDSMYEKGKALNAASHLEFDGVIDPADTRATVLRGLNGFGPIGPGSRRMIDTW